MSKYENKKAMADNWQHRAFSGENYNIDIVSEILFPKTPKPRVFTSEYYQNIYEDYENSYFVNSLSMRSPEPEKSTELVVLGCSQTFGVGVPVEATWGKFLSDMLGCSYASYAITGASLSYMSDYLEFHIRNYGIPKYVAALAPNFSRNEFPVDGINLTTKNAKTKNTPKVEPIRGPSGSFAKSVHISKRPHIVEEIMTLEALYYFSNRDLLKILSICSANNIKCVWTSWDGDVVDLYSSIYKNAEKKKNPLPYKENFVSIDKYLWDINVLKDLPALDCHQDLKNKYTKTFDFGLDNQFHYGVHAHAHIADVFYTRISSMKNR